VGTPIHVPISFSETTDDIVEEFEQSSDAMDASDILRALTIESMHLASAARWWLPSQGALPQHINLPPDISALDNWLFESVSYLKQELVRCVLRRNY
jgi:hypothetical protein